MNAIQGRAYQGMVGLHMCVPEIFGPVAFSWSLRRLITLLKAYPGFALGPPTVKLLRRFGLEDFLRLRFVNDLVYGVWIVPFIPDNLLQDVGSSREETPGRRLPLLYD